MTDNIDNKFDEVEKVVDRTSRLILKIVGAVVGVGLAVFIAVEQFKGDDVKAEPVEQKIEAVKKDTSVVDTLKVIL